MTTIKREILSNGLEVIFEDQSNRYFGDYHRVCIVATLRCNLDALEDRQLMQQAIELHGPRLDVERRFERMGVPTAEVDDVRNALIDDYMKHASGYLSRPDYPGLLVKAELNKRRSSRFYA